MTTDAIAADNTPISIDQAVALLDAADKREEAPAEAEAASTEGQNTEAEPAAEAASEPETATDGETAETDDAPEEAEEAELPAIEPPRFWDADKKELFKGLPREAQEYLLAKESERDKATSKAMEEAANARNKANGEASKITQLSAVLDKLLPQATETFNSRWKNVDWNAVVDQYGADQALKLRNQFEQEMGQVQQLQAAKAEADQIQHARFVEAETAKLPQLCPDLVDAQHGATRRADLAKFLIDNGYTPDVLNRISALETSIAYDAMRFRKAQADAKAKADAPKPAPKPPVTPKPSVRSTAAPSKSGSPKMQEYQRLAAMKVHTMDQATRFLDLKDELNL